MHCPRSSLILIASSLALAFAVEEMNTIYEWDYIDYLYDSDAARQEAINSGKYRFGNILPMDVDRSRDGRIFMTFMGSRGVPAVLGTVSDQQGKSGPLIKPYPDWSYFNPDDCESILNVYRIAIDECNRLWALDTGFIEGEIIKCHAKLWVFDLNTDKLLDKIVLPDDIARDAQGRTMLTNPIVETEGPMCKNTTVFMAESQGNAIIIWNGVRLFRLESPMFKPVKGATNVTVGKNSMDMDTGVVGMAVSPRIFPGEPRYLYFRALGSLDLLGASTEVLKRSTFGETVKFFGERDILSSQAVGQAFSAEGTLFLGMTGPELGVACWNRYMELKPENILMVAQDDERLQYLNGVKVIPPREGNREQEVLVLSNKFIDFMLSQLRPNEKNFRVLGAPVRKLIENTKCAFPRENQEALEQIGERLIIQ